MPHTQQGCNVFLHLLNDFRAFRLDADRLDVGNAKHSLLRGRERHYNQIILILPSRRLPLPCQYPNNAEGRFVDPDRLAQRTHLAEQIFGHRSSQHRYPVAGIHVTLGNEAAICHVKVAHGQKIRCGSLHRSNPVLAAEYCLILALYRGRHQVDAGYFPGNCLSILVSQAGR